MAFPDDIVKAMEEQLCHDTAPFSPDGIPSFIRKCVRTHLRISKYRRETGEPLYRKKADGTFEPFKHE